MTTLSITSTGSQAHSITEEVYYVSLEGLLQLHQLAVVAALDLQRGTEGGREGNGRGVGGKLAASV